MAKKRQEKQRAEPWEVEYMHREFPVKSEEELERAVEECKQKSQQTGDQRKLTDCAERKISR